MQGPERELPIFRSAGQARLLALLMAGPDDRWRTVTDAARQLGVAPSSVGREADRLVGAGLLEEQRIGNVRRIRANHASRYYPELHGLLLKAAGPVPVVADALAAVTGIREAHIFGSWARRIEGTAQGEPPRDVDLLVVGEPDPAAVYRATAEAAAVLGQDVEPVIVTAGEWDEAGRGGGPPFLRAVRDGPLVGVIGSRQ